MSLAILFHFLCAQHISDINISIIRILRIFCCITTLVVFFLVRCVLDFRCGWVGVVSVLQAAACNTDTTPTQPNWNSNTHRTKNNTTNVVIQQNSRKLLMMDILMSETFWAHKKWNKIASDIKLVFYSSAITTTHGPINIRLQYIYSPHTSHSFPHEFSCILFTFSSCKAFRCLDNLQPFQLTDRKKKIHNLEIQKTALHTRFCWSVFRLQ